MFFSFFLSGQFDNIYCFDSNNNDNFRCEDFDIAVFIIGCGDLFYYIKFCIYRYYIWNLLYQILLISSIPTIIKIICSARNIVWSIFFNFQVTWFFCWLVIFIFVLSFIWFFLFALSFIFLLFISLFSSQVIFFYLIIFIFIFLFDLLLKLFVFF